MASDEIRLIVKAEVGKALRGLDRVEQKTKNVGKKSEGLFGLLKSGWASAALGIGIAIRALATLTRGLGVAVKAASDFEEANAKFNVVFRGVTQEANRMRDELVRGYGVSTQAATVMLSSIQDFLVPMGIARAEASKLSGQFVTLAADVGSFNNVATDKVLQDFQSALAGSTETVRKYGIDVSEMTLKQMAMQRGIELTGGRLDRQTRAMLIYEKIVADTADAQGDFERTQTSMANTMRRSKALADDLILAFGQGLQIALEQVVVDLSKLVSQLRNNEDQFRAVANTVTTVGIVVGGVVKGFFTSYRDLFLGGKQLIDGFTSGISAFVRLFQNAFSTIGRSIIEYGKLYTNATTFKFKEAGENLKAIVNISKSGVKDLTQDAADIGDAFEQAFSGGLTAAGGFFGVTAIKQILEDIENGKATIDDFWAAFSQGAEEAASGTKTVGEEVVKLEEVINETATAAQQVGDSIASMAKQVSQQELDATLQRLEQEKQARLAAVEDRINTENMAQARLNMIRNAETNEEIDRLKLERDAAIAAGDEALAAELGRRVASIESQAEAAEREKEIEADLAAAEKAIEDDILARKKDAELEAFESNKKTSVLQSIINTALGVTKALSSSPPPFNFISAAAVGAAGAIQTAAITSQKPPAFADGGFTPPRETLATVGERGREFVVPADLTQRMVSAIESGVVNGGSSVYQIGEVRFDNYDAFQSYLSRYFRENGRFA